MTSSSPDAAYLERFAEQGGPAERIDLDRSRLLIGRSESAGHTIYSSAVSKTHAELLKIGDRYLLRDLQSTNGTFVNGERIAERVLNNGDIIHFAQVEFCFRQGSSHAPTISGVEESVSRTQALEIPPPSSLIRGTEMLRELLRTEAVDVLFQPIVHLRTGEVIGYEALGRGTHPDLSRSPGVILALAEQCGLAVEVSRLFRQLAVRQCGDLPAPARLFLNIHRQELDHASLIDSLTALLPEARHRRMVIEIPESAVTDVATMARLRAALHQLNVEIAYDDFGAGQARLLELTEAPPHYVKLDKTMVEGIQTSLPRREILEALLRAARSLDVRIIAEGLETRRAAAACLQLGCELGQGYLFCPPASSPEKPPERRRGRTARPRAASRPRRRPAR
jgi:EAL domain-containing protein (putative c-di-GMP-specific phosphodiesterase class I)